MRVSVRIEVVRYSCCCARLGAHFTTQRRVTDPQVISPGQGPLGRVGGGLFLSHPHERRAV